MKRPIGWQEGRKNARIRTMGYHRESWCLEFLGICFVVASSKSELVFLFVIVQRTILSPGSVPGSPYMFQMISCLPKLTQSSKPFLLQQKPHFLAKMTLCPRFCVCVCVYCLLFLFCFEARSQVAHADLKLSTSRPWTNDDSDSAFYLWDYKSAPSHWLMQC